MRLLEGRGGKIFLPLVFLVQTPRHIERYIPMARTPLDFIKGKFMPLLECQILQMSNDETAAERVWGDMG